VILGILALLMITLGGAGMARLLKLKWLEFEAGIGIATLGIILVLFLGGMLGIPFTPLYYFTMLILAASSAYWLRMQFVAFRNGQLKFKRREVTYTLLRYALPTCAISLLCWYGMSRPLFTMPAVEIHGLKSKLFLTHGGIGTWFYAESGWQYLRNHYPPGFSLITMVVGKMAGGYEDATIRIVPLFYLASILWLTQRLAYKIDRGIIAAILPSLLFLSPQFTDLARYFYAAPCLLYLGMLGGYLLIKPSPQPALGMFFLLGMGWIKNEGFLLAFCIISVWLLSQIYLRKQKLVSLGKHFLPSIALVLPWILTLQMYQLGESSFDWSRSASYFSNIPFHLSTSRLLIDEMFTGKEIYSGIWWMLLAAILLKNVHFSSTRNAQIPFQTLGSFLLMSALWVLLVSLIFHCSLDPSNHALAIWRLFLLPTLGACLLVIHLTRHPKKL